MKTNIFNVREKKEDKIVIEEERTKKTFLLFFRRHKRFLLLTIFLLGICSILIGTGLAFSLFQSSNEFDISFLEGDETINSNNNPNIDDDTVSEDLLGEVSRKLGIVILTETFMSSNGDVIYYYSDKSTIIVTSDGKIYRVSSIDDGKNYGVDRDGKINEKAKKKLVTSTTTTLQDGTIITYYSDGTAKVEHNDLVYFVRDSNNIKTNNGTTLNNLAPSGVAPSTTTKKQGNVSATRFTDKTTEVTDGNQKLLVNKNASSTIEDNNITYDKNNSFKPLEEKKLSDGNTITYYENGSAVITDKEGNKTYVKKSGDIIIKDNTIYEIIPNDYGYSKGVVECPDGRKVTYYDNGSAVIEEKDGTKKYVEDSDELLYNNNKNITSEPTSSKQKSVGKTPDGKNVVNFENGKSQVTDPDGSSYITDTQDIIFDTSGNIEEPERKPSDITPPSNKPNNTPSPSEEDPTKGLFVTDAENKYNYSKSVEDTTFTIKNTNTKSRKYRIVIEEISDYKKFDTDRLEPQFVKFQATIGDNYVPATTLTDNTWTNEKNKVTYIIFDGVIKPKETLEVALSLYVDYAKLNNSHQNKGFIGTIKVYADFD